MFALPFTAGPLPAASLRSGQEGTGLDGLEGLLGAVDGAEGGFSTELQALLLQMTPQMLARLESLMGSGMDLPQAARQLLVGSAGGWPQGGAEGGLGPEMSLKSLATAGLPVTDPAFADGKPQSGLVALPRFGLDLAQSVSLAPVSSAMAPAGAQTAQGNGLTPQLASSLLDMGLPQPVGTRTWHGAVAERVMWMAQGDQQFARLTLNPPQLGPLEVRVAINQEQTSVTFLSSHAAVREALEVAMPRLRELFDQQSMSLVHAEVADPGARRDSQAGRSSDGEGFAAHDDGQSPGDGPDTAALELPLIAARGLVDLFA